MSCFTKLKYSFPSLDTDFSSSWPVCPIVISGDRGISNGMHSRYLRFEVFDEWNTVNTSIMNNDLWKYNLSSGSSTFKEFSWLGAGFHVIPIETHWFPYFDPTLDIFSPFQISANVMSMLLYHPTTLRRLSSHWQTGETISDDMIAEVLNGKHAYTSRTM